MLRLRRLAGCEILLLVGMAVMSLDCHAQWQTTSIRQLDGDHALTLTAERQDVTEGWNQIAQIPYLVFMPEKDRVLMVLNRGKTLHAMVLASDDHGTTWSEPRYVQAGADGGPGDKSSTATGLTYLGRGRLLLHMGTRHWFSDDYGDTWGKSRPIPPATSGKTWYE